MATATQRTTISRATQNGLDLWDCVGDFLDCIEAASMPHCLAFADDVVLDATVPNWRMSVSGAEAVLETFAGWFADPGQFEEIRRTPVRGGEVVEFTLAWEEHGVPHACHQAHLIETRDGRIVRDTAFCGGRWPASLLAEMEAAAHAG